MDKETETCLAKNMTEKQLDMRKVDRHERQVETYSVISHHALFFFFCVKRTLAFSFLQVKTQTACHN